MTRHAPPRRRRIIRRRVLFLGVATIVLVALLAVTVLLYRLADATRGVPVREVASGGDAPPAVTDPRFATTMEAITGVALSDGHTVEILFDNAVFSRMLEDIGAAQQSVTFFSYFCEPGRLGERIAAALAARARAGARVLVLGDGFSCADWIGAVRDPLVAAGAEVSILRPVRWYALHRAQHRNHTRMVVIDGRIAYTGGFGVADQWSGDADARPWRDTNVRFTGPAVRTLQGDLLAAWAEATGRLEAGSAFFPGRAHGAPGVADAAGSGVVAGLLSSSPGLETTPVERYLALTIAGAGRTLYVANSYFVPPPLVRRLLREAAARGVDVRVLVPGRRTDVPSTRWAGRGYYDEMLEAGVRIYEYRPVMMHAKTLVADGEWAAIGSVNLDNRSMRINDESALLVHDTAVAAVLDAAFLADLESADEITLDARRAVPFWERAIEAVTRGAASLL